MIRWFKKLFRRDESCFGFDDVSESRDIIDDLQGLNEKYIKMFIDIYNHESVCDDSFVIVSKQETARQYVAELALKRAEARTKNKEKFYLAEAKEEMLDIYTYRRRFKKYDSPTKQALKRRAQIEASNYLTNLEKDNENLEQSQITFENLFAMLTESMLSSVGVKKYPVVLSELAEISTTYKNAQDYKKVIEQLNKLDDYIYDDIRWKKRRNEIYRLVGKLIDYCEHALECVLEDKKSRTSDITVLRLIAEILKGKRGVPVLPAPLPQTVEGQAPPDYDSQSAENNFISPEEADELEAAMLDELNGTDLDELYELENELEEVDGGEPKTDEFEDGEE